MKTPRYIKASNLPPRIGFLIPLVWWLVLERFNAPAWLYGVMYTLIGLLYLAEIVRLLKGEAVDLLGNDKNDDKKA